MLSQEERPPLNPAVSGSGAGTASRPGAASPKPQASPWLPLREEIRLSQGPPSEQGSPSWTLHDPAAHRFFRIGWLEFEVLSRWPLGSAEAIQQSICRETMLNASLPSIQAVYDFALRNSLLLACSPQDTARLIQMKTASRTSAWQTIVHGYLFLRIPLLRPDAWLERHLRYVRWMFSATFLVALLTAALLGLYLVSREQTAFLLHLENLWTWQQSIMVLFALAMTKMAHELGHAFAAKHLHLRVPRMGIALMCFFPVLWTDVSEAWKLPRRSDRLLVDVSGIGAELILAASASLLWPLLLPGAAKSAVLTLAGVTWITTLAINANPCMRYDGYYILSDYWEVPGLQQRAFALARWFLREQVFGFGDPPPEAMPPRMQKKLLLYAYGTWIYRFFLFLGIALLVYHLFFKALGIILMLVELIWFIFLPIYKEIMHWHARRTTIRFTWQTARSGILAVTALILFIVPWHTSIEGNGLLSARHTAILYAPQPAQVESISVQPGQTATEGQVLLRLRSPDLDARQNISQRKLEILRNKLAAASLDPELRFSYATDIQEMQAVASELAWLRQEQARLTITAPFTGVFHDLPGWFTPDSWVPEKMKLGVVAEPGGIVTAYVAEEDMERLDVGMPGKFYPGSGFFPPLKVRIQSLEHAATRDIPQPELPTTVLGGIVPAKRMPNGRIVPEQALYKIICQVEEGELPVQSLSGKVFFDGQRRSFALRFWQAAIGLLIRESGLH